MMTKKLFPRVLALGAGLVFTSALAACGSAASGKQASSGPPPPPKQRRLSPPITTPKDAMAQQPCDLLSSQDVQELGLRVGSAEPKKDPQYGDSCSWMGEGGRTVIAGPVTGAQSLEGLYQKRDKLPVFEPATIGGQPAAHAETMASGPGCDYYAAADEKTTVYVSGGGPSDVDWCDLGKRAAEAVVKNLPNK